MTDAVDVESTEPNFSENMRFFRETQGWSQSELARRLQEAGLSTFHQTTVSRLEKGERPIRLAEARVIAAVLEVSLNTMWSDPENVDLLGELRQALKRHFVVRSQLYEAMKRFESIRTDLQHIIDLAEDTHLKPDWKAVEGSIQHQLAVATSRAQEDVSAIAERFVNGEHQAEA